MAERIVVALGGNALGKTPEQQLELVRNTARPIVDLVEKGYEVIIGHAEVRQTFHASAVGTIAGCYVKDGKITREQMAAMMRRYASFKKLDTSAKADLSTFADASAVSAWATGDMQWAVASELLYGNNHNQLQPTANATRAQAAAILQRFATKIVK